MAPASPRPVRRRPSGCSRSVSAASSVRWAAGGAASDPVAAPSTAKTAPHASSGDPATLPSAPVPRRLLRGPGESDGDRRLAAGQLFGLLGVLLTLPLLAVLRVVGGFYAARVRTRPASAPALERGAPAPPNGARPLRTA